MSSSSQVVESWISSFCNLLGHEYFADVSEDFIEDDFNLTGLSSQVPMYKEALEMILDVEPEDDEDEEEDEEEEDEDEELGEDRLMAAAYRRGGAADRRAARTNADLNQIETSAELLYGLIHQRYITSRPGIQQMHEKYELGHFGVCPRVFCNGCKVLPVGCSDLPGQETVKLYCPSCLDIYVPPNSRFQTVDGAFFGTTFGCLFFMTFPDVQLAPRPNNLHINASATNNTAGDASNASANGDDRSSLAGGSTSLTTATGASQGTAGTNNGTTEINGVAAVNLAPGLGSGHIYEPRIYGFRVSERAKSGPRMKWLRMKPDEIGELDEARRYLEPAAVEVVAGDEDMDDEYVGAGGGEEGDAGEDVAMMQQQQGADVGGPHDAGDVVSQQQQTALDGRKKAPMKRRRVRASEEGSAAGSVAHGGSGTNGNINGVG